MLPSPSAADATAKSEAFLDYARLSPVLESLECTVKEVFGVDEVLFFEDFRRILSCSPPFAPAPSSKAALSSSLSTDSSSPTLTTMISSLFSFLSTILSPSVPSASPAPPALRFSSLSSLFYLASSTGMEEHVLRSVWELCQLSPSTSTPLNTFESIRHLITTVDEETKATLNEVLEANKNSNAITDEHKNSLNPNHGSLTLSRTRFDPSEKDPGVNIGDDGLSITSTTSAHTHA